MVVSQDNIEIIDKIQSEKIIAVISIDDHHKAKDLLHCLYESQIRNFEITLRSKESRKSAKIFSSENLDINLGIGTVLTTDDINFVTDIGADFALAPGTNKTVIDEANRLNLPFFPGVCSPSDIEKANELGCSVLKFFPAEPCGGINYFKSMISPYTHLGLKFISLGGINLDNISNYIENQHFIGVGGSWIAEKKLIENSDWNEISKRAKDTLDLIKS